MKKAFLLGALVLALVFMGCDDGNGGGKKDGPYTITINGTRPATGADLAGASLMAPTAPTVPLAVAMLSGNGPYEFKVAGAGGMPTTADFNTPGTYILGVANAMGGNVHMYTGGTLIFSATVRHYDLNWNQFAPQP